MRKQMPKARTVKQSLELLQVMTNKKSIDDCKVLGKTPKKKTQHEAQEQKLLFQWARLQQCKYPELELMFAIPNGGSRHIIEARNLKLQGVKSGVCDIFLPVARENYYGFFLELKVRNNKLSDNQRWWCEKLEEQGYFIAVCYGFEEAKEAILEYLKL